MIKLYRIILALCISICIVSCSKETPYLNLSTDEIRLAHASGSGGSFVVESNYNWTIEAIGASSPNVTISQTSGGAAATTVNITVTTQNDSKLQLELCKLRITESESGVSKSIDIIQRRVPAPQTTLMFFTGTSLRSYFNLNLADVQDAVSEGALGENGRLIYLMTESSTKASLYEIVKEESKNSFTTQKLKSYTKFNWSLDGSMAQVIADVKAEANITAESDNTINLVLSGHGTGWVLKEHPTLTRLLNDNHTSIWEPTSSLHPTRFMGSSSDGFFDIAQLQGAIEQSGTKFGYILFDECFMSSIELIYRLRNCSDYIIASPAEVMADGFPYDRILRYMFDNNGMDFNIAKICEEYYNSYNESRYTPYATVAACVTSKIDGLAAAMSAIDFRDLDDNTRNSLQYYEGLSRHVFYDLMHYVTTNGVGDVDAVHAAFDAAFPIDCRLHTPTYYTAIGNSGSKDIKYYSGVTTSAASTMFRDDWVAEPWSIATGQSN